MRYTTISITWCTTTGSFRLKILNTFEFSVDFTQQWKKRLVTIGFDVDFGQHFQKVTTSLTSKRWAILSIVWELFYYLGWSSRLYHMCYTTLSRRQWAIMLARGEYFLPRPWSVSCISGHKVNVLTYMAQNLSQMLSYTKSTKQLNMMPYLKIHLNPIFGW